jgi:hypothetical protein
LPTFSTCGSRKSKPNGRCWNTMANKLKLIIAATWSALAAAVEILFLGQNPSEVLSKRAR